MAFPEKGDGGKYAAFRQARFDEAPRKTGVRVEFPVDPMRPAGSFWGGHPSSGRPFARIAARSAGGSWGEN